MTPWYSTLEAASLLGVILVLAGKTGNFQCRIGIQTADTTTDSPNAAVNPSAATAQVTTAGTRTWIRFDPNGASDGDIDASAYFRVGVFFSLSSGSTPAAGSVQLVDLGWR
jgi:hypothetical protein